MHAARRATIIGYYVDLNFATKLDRTSRRATKRGRNAGKGAVLDKLLLEGESFGSFSV